MWKDFAIMIHKGIADLCRKQVAKCGCIEETNKTGLYGVILFNANKDTEKEYIRP